MHSPSNVMHTEIKFLLLLTNLRQKLMVAAESHFEFFIRTVQSKLQGGGCHVSQN